MTLTPVPDLARHLADIEQRLDQLDRRRQGTFIDPAASTSTTSSAAALLFAKQMFGNLNDPGDGSPVDPWSDNGYGGLFDPGSTNPNNDDCCYMSTTFWRDVGIGSRTGIAVAWLTDAEGSFGAGDWGWIDTGQYHQSDPTDTNGYGLSGTYWEFFCFDPARGAGAYGDIFLECFQSDFAEIAGASAELLLDADLYAQGFAETRAYALAGRDFSGGGDGVPTSNTGIQLRMNYIRDDDGDAHQTDPVLSISAESQDPTLAHDGSYILVRDDSGVDWWHGGVRGPVLTDRSTADRYRVIVASDVIGSELA